jgi:hypothetical protein
MTMESRPGIDIVGVPLLYARQGYPNCIITLREDGTIAQGTGHAEAHWSWEGMSLVLHDAAGAEMGRLEPQLNTYKGTVLGRIDVALRPWPMTYHFGGPLGERLAAIRDSRPMRYLLGIPFVNSRDLLERAIASVPNMRHCLVIIDNSNLRELRGRCPVSDELVYEPPVPLSFVQSMNLLQQMAHEAECEVVCFMHNDAEAEPGMDQLFLERVTDLWKTNHEFGVMFTCYDALAAINMETVRKIGPWDNLFTQYFADVEYYARLKKHGFDQIESNIAVIHRGSMTIKSDHRLEAANSILVPAYARIFRELCK